MISSLYEVSDPSHDRYGFQEYTSFKL
jgi:hypothetical protein